MKFADLLKEPGAEVVQAPSSPQPPLKFADLLAAPGAEVIEPPGKLEALGRGALQGATLGHGDELVGGITGLLQAGANAFDPNGPSVSDAYKFSRDSEREKNAAAAAAHPALATLASAAASQFPAKLLPGGPIGSQALAGGINALGASNDLSADSAGKTALGALGGAAGALGGQLVGKGVSALAGKVAPALAKKAGDFAAQSLGGEAAGATRDIGERELAAGGLPFLGKLQAHPVADTAAALQAFHGNIPGALLTAGAPRVKDLATPALAKGAMALGDSLGAVGRAAARNPALLGKFGGTLARAAQSGPAALNATHFALAQSDPAYQRKVLDLQNHPDLQRDTADAPDQDGE